MDTDSSPASSHYRDGRLVVIRHGRDCIRPINREIEEISRLAKAENPLATSPPLVSGVFSVQDAESRSSHLILVHRLNHRSPPAPAVGKVAAFSEPSFAPYCTEKLQLATPAYYRGREDLKPGIRDPHDGTLTKDATRWANTVVTAAAVSRAELSFGSSNEPWVYCAAHYRDQRELRRLREHFATEYRYTTATGIADPDAFATWLGIDFALALDKTADVKLGALEKIVYARSRCDTSLWEGSNRIDTVVHVHHGPVRYEDRSGRVDTQEHSFDPYAGPRAWFTKRTSLRPQSEYRFAVSTLGDPVEPKHYITVSPELRALVSAL